MCSNKRHKAANLVLAFNGVYTNSFLVVCFIAAWHDYYQKLVLRAEDALLAAEGNFLLVVVIDMEQAATFVPAPR